jgi:hypothetical protein
MKSIILAILLAAVPASAFSQTLAQRQEQQRQQQQAAAEAREAAQARANSQREAAQERQAAQQKQNEDRQAQQERQNTQREEQQQRQQQVQRQEPPVRQEAPVTRQEAPARQESPVQRQERQEAPVQRQEAPVQRQAAPVQHHEAPQRIEQGRIIQYEGKGRPAVVNGHRDVAPTVHIGETLRYGHGIHVEDTFIRPGQNYNMHNYTYGRPVAVRFGDPVIVLYPGIRPPSALWFAFADALHVAEALTMGKQCGSMYSYTEYTQVFDVCPNATINVVSLYFDGTMSGPDVLQQGWVRDDGTDGGNLIENAGVSTIYTCVVPYVPSINPDQTYNCVWPQ